MVGRHGGTQGLVGMVERQLRLREVIVPLHVGGCVEFDAPEAVVDAEIPGLEAEAGHGAVGEEFGVLRVLLDGFAVEHFGGSVVAILEVSRGRFVWVSLVCVLLMVIADRGTGGLRVPIAFFLQTVCLCRHSSELYSGRIVNMFRSQKRNAAMVSARRRLHAVEVKGDDTCGAFRWLTNSMSSVMQFNY